MKKVIRKIKNKLELNKNGLSSVNRSINSIQYSKDGKTKDSQNRIKELRVTQSYFEGQVKALETCLNEIYSAQEFPYYYLNSEDK